MNVGQRIKSFRKSIKKTQAEFGEMLGTSRDAISNYEIGRVEASNTFIQLLVTKFNLSEEWLLNGTGDMLLKTETALSNLL